MKKTLSLLAIVLATHSYAAAQSPTRGGPPEAGYGYISFGAAFIADAELDLEESRYGFPGPATDDVSFSTGFTAGGGLGIYIPETPLAIEGEVFFIGGADLKEADVFADVAAAAGAVFADTATIGAPTVASFLNLIADRETLRGARVYGGAGLGYGRTSYELSGGGFVSQALNDSTSNAFAYQIKLGVDAPIVNWESGGSTTIGLGYRFFSMPKNTINFSVGGVGEGKYTYDYSVSVVELRLKSTF